MTTSFAFTTHHTPHIAKFSGRDVPLQAGHDDLDTTYKVRMRDLWLNPALFRGCETTEENHSLNTLA